MSSRFNLKTPKMFIRTRYEKLPGGESSQTSSPLFGKGAWAKGYRSPMWANRLQRPRMSFARIVMLVIVSILLVSMTVTGIVKGRWKHHHNKGDDRKLYHWEHYPRLRGLFNGVRTLVPYSDYVSEQNFVKYSQSANPDDNIKQKWPLMDKEHKEPPMDPIRFDPYPKWDSKDYLKNHEEVHTCYLDESEKVELPNIYAYPGIPQNQTAPFFGSYEELGINDKVCFDRFGRFGPYGYSYPREQGGFGLADKSEKNGADRMWSMESKIDYSKVSWGKAQKRCYEKNKARFLKNVTQSDSEENHVQKKKVPRHAYILRTWTGYKYSEQQILTIRAMINELSLKSGGEYDVHFLLHVKDDSIPIWSSDEFYEKTIRDNLPEEFWGMATLWSEQQMRLYYPEPFPNNVYNHAKAPVHSVYRSAHFPLQWFSQVHPEYDFYWNWEMDLRLSGHYWEFNTKIGDWARRQPRKGMWERASRYYIPDLHGSWKNFTDMVEEEMYNSDEKPVWGPPKFENTGMLESPPETEPPKTYLADDYQWGVGEDADLITFNPIFDPAKTNWVFRDDVSGYDLELPEPPRRCAIITVSRLSKRLLDLMHRETYLMRHHMFPEMWPPTVAFHHGLKAVYAPHAVYFDHNWPLESLDGTYNHPPKPTDSVFGWGEHNQLGNSFYYNAGFSSELWRRWLGGREYDQGGPIEEENGSGRLCLRPTLFHPVKHENLNI